jgi:hypothetical protein
MVRHGSVHDVMPLREVRSDCLLSRHTGTGTQTVTAVIAVEPTRSFALLPEGEQQTILFAFRGLLARLPIGEEISIHARIRPYDLTPYLDRLHAAQQERDVALRALARDHEQFVQALAASHALLQHEFFVRLSTRGGGSQRRPRGKRSPALLFEQARLDLSHKTQALLDDLERCGLHATRLSSEALIEYYRSCLHLHHAEQGTLSRALVEAVGRPLEASPLSPLSPHAATRAQAVIVTETPEEGSAAYPEEHPSRAPLPEGERRWVWAWGRTLARHQRHEERRATLEPAAHLISLPELIQPSLIEQSRHYLTVHQETSEYSRVRAVIGYPRQLETGWFDRLLALDEPYVDALLILEKRDPVALTRLLTNKMSKLRANQWLEWRAGQTENPQTQAARDDVEPLRDALVRAEEHVHAVSLLLCTRAESVAALKARDQRVAALLHRLDLVSTELTYEHLPAWQSFLPDGGDPLKRRRLLDTSSLVTAFPFTVCNLSTPEPGVLIGTTATRGPILIDPSSAHLENGHELIIACSGAGKSFYVKLWILRGLLQGYPCIVIDPEDEYAPLAQAVGGTVVRLAPGAFPLNPLELVPIPGERRLLEEKIESLLVLCDLLLADKAAGVLSQREKGYLSRMLLQCYAEAGITDDPATHRRTAPTMGALTALIEAEGDPYQIAERLQRHGALFAEETQVALDAALLVFSIRDLPADLKPIGLYVVTEFVWNTIRQEAAPRPRFLMVDEAWTLMQYPEGGEFLSSLSRRARKYHLHLKLITQNAEDFLASKAGRVIVQNSAMKLLMKQDSSTIEAVAKAFALSPEETAYLPTCRPGEGLFVLQAARIPLFVASSETEYQLATTRPDDRWQALPVAAQTEEEMERATSVSSIERWDLTDLLLEEEEDEFEDEEPP